jgi:hypothetical protein
MEAMMIALTTGIAALTRQAATIADFVSEIAPEQARWKPSPADWSLLEVINHLYDEEQFDFRVRIDYLLHQPGEEAPPIDPEGWVTERRYNERDLATSVANFEQERAVSLAWLRGLDNPDWEAAYVAPWGIIKAGDIFAAWTAHDLLHLRQLVELTYAYQKKQAAPYDIAYAGEW